MESAKTEATKSIDNNIPVDTTVCPACGHFVGVYERCPRCGTYLPKRTSLKFFKFFSLFLAIFGLFFLYLWVLNQKLPTIKISTISETMNFAYVHLSGTVSRDAQVYYDEFENGVKRPSRITFTINDETGSISVGAFKTVAEQMIEKNILPAAGDKIDLEGQLKVKGNYINITVQAIDQIQLQEAEAKPLALKEIDNEHLDKAVQVEGEIINIREPRAGSRAPYTLLISDGVASASMVFWSNVAQDLNSNNMKVGSKIKAKVTVGMFNGQPQLKLTNAQDITFEDVKKEDAKKVEPTTNTEAVLMNVADVANKVQDSLVRLEGVVVAFNEFSGGYKGYFRDDSGSIEIIFWNNEFKDDPAFLNQIKVGTRLNIVAKVNFHKGKVQVHPCGVKNTTILKDEKPVVKEVPEVSKSDVNKIEKETSVVAVPEKEAVTPTDSIELADLSQVQEYLQKRVTVVATILQVDVLPNGLYAFTIIDSKDNSLLLIVRENQYEEAEAKFQACKENVKIKVTGKATVFNNTPQISLQNVNELVIIN